MAVRVLKLKKSHTFKKSPVIKRQGFRLEWLRFGKNCILEDYTWPFLWGRNQPKARPEKVATQYNTSSPLG